MVAVVDERYKLFDRISDKINSIEYFMSFNKGDYLLFEHNGKEHKFLINEIIHKLPFGGFYSLIIVVSMVNRSL